MRWLNDLSLQFLQQEYLQPGETVDQRVEIIAATAENILDKPGFANKFKDYFSRGWFSLSTPIWTNFGSDRGLPISCFGSYIEDDSESILYTQAEVSMMSKGGGGTSAYFGNLRPRGALIKGGRNGHSGGSVHFMQIFDKNIQIWSQGSTRRGSFAAYLPVEHPDIMEFLSIKSEGHPIQDISFGVTVTDAFMNAMIQGDYRARTIWAKVLESRANVGYPYIAFIDTVNRNTVDVYKDLKMLITQSNLCTEILLPNNLLESFVCDLLSLNILYYDEWCNTDLLEVVVYLLDAVMTDFINKAKHIRFMERAVRFAENHRALGIGWLGWHSYLQSRSIPFESMQAKLLNTKIAKDVYTKARTASAKMAVEYGEPLLLKGYGRRHTTVMAIAPTTSSAFILEQVSKAIEPEPANIYIKDLAKGKFTIKNRYLEKLLEEKGCNKQEVWDNIIMHNGSVQQLPFLTDDEKAVFKTFREISPMETVIQAAQRQRYIDQGQSLNLMINPQTPIRDVNALLIKGWEMGVKTFYYQFSVNAAQEFSRNILRCVSCEA
jgi:ribonucleoside-diphosphate reductase alpha chain